MLRQPPGEPANHGGGRADAERFRADIFAYSGAIGERLAPKGTRSTSPPKVMRSRQVMRSIDMMLNRQEMTYPRLVRTTLDIDDDVLEFARTQAKAEGVSIGAALSRLAQHGVDAILVTGVGHGLVRRPDGLVTLHPGHGKPLTSDDVEAALAAFDLEDAGDVDG